MSTFIRVTVSADSDRGDRRQMEDLTQLVHDDSAPGGGAVFLAVFDGHGGAEAANFARRSLWPALRSRPALWGGDRELARQAVRDSFLAVQRDMWRQLPLWPHTRLGEPSTAGTTVCALLLCAARSTLYVAHVGDSRAVLGEEPASYGPRPPALGPASAPESHASFEPEDGERPLCVKLLTRDHKPGDPAERQRIERLGGRVLSSHGVDRVAWMRPLAVHRGLALHVTVKEAVPFLAVSRSLGDLWSYNSALSQFVVSPEPDVEVHSLDPERHRYLILGTDGLWDVVTAKDAVALCQRTEAEHQRSGDAGRTMAQALVAEALSGWRRKGERADNVAAVVMRMRPQLPPPQPPTSGNTTTANSSVVDVFVCDVSSSGDDISSSSAINKSSGGN